MKIVLAGSPQIAVKTFEKIIKNFNVVAIITQPDRKKGRNLKLTPTPVSLLAKKYSVKVFKPNKIIEIKKDLEKLKFDLFLTFAFGQYVPVSILNLGKFKPLNIHGSILPKYRGPAPIHYAILNGDEEIGISLIEMTKEIDAGDIYFKAKQKIDSKITTGKAFEIISNLASKKIVPWILKIINHDFKKQKQGSNFTLTKKIKKDFGKLNTEDDAQINYRKIKALNPNPGSYMFIKNKRVKVFDASFKKVKGALEINCNDKTLYVTEYQFESKNKINIKKTT